MPTSDKIDPRNVPKLPVVTICVVTSNNEDTIEQCIDSLSQQDYPALNIFVADNFSTDSTIEKINVVFQTEKKLPIGKVKNNIIQNEKIFKDTNIFAMIDPTTELFPDMISKCVLKIMEYPKEVCAVYCDHWVIEKNRKIPKYYNSYNRQLLEQDTECFGPNIILNKIALETKGFYKDSLRMYENYDLLMRLSEQFIPVHIPEMLYIQRGKDELSYCVLEDECKNPLIIPEKAIQKK